MKRATGIAAALALLASTLSASAQTPAPAPDALKAIFCGTSGPLPVKDRAKPCVAVQAGDKLYIVDIGPEATENLMTWRTPVATTRAVFITHLHSDHIGGLGEFNLQSWVAGRTAPLPVYGPEGVDALAKGFNQAYVKDHQFRRAHHAHDGVDLPIKAGELVGKVVKVGAKPVVALKDGDVTVTAIAVEHAPVSPAFAYRFDYKGRSLVISGDTKKAASLASASKGADILIHEAQNADMTTMMAAGLKAQGNPRMSAIMHDTLSYHTTPVEAAETAKEAGVKALVLYHITQAGLPFYTAQSFTKGMDEVGGPPWKIAIDGTTVTLPVGSTDISYGQQ
jgi:ribonuclease Z